MQKQKILDFINSKEYVPMKPKEMCFLMSVPSEQQHIFDQIIDQLEQQGEIILSKKGKIMLPKMLNAVLGTFQSTRKRFGFVVSKDGKYPDIYITSRNANGAMHTDEVLCRIVESDYEYGYGRPEGVIVKVIKRGFSEIVGLYYKDRFGGFVMPDNKKIGYDIFIPKSKSMGAVDGHKVVVKITKPPIDGELPEGKVVEILGHKNDPGVDILSVIRGRNIEVEFNQKVMEQTSTIPEEVCEEEIDLKKRTDLRNLLMVTIDGEDTKDIDDAVSLEMLENGNFRLGVHIADVAHYVKKDSPLDDCAIARGTSVYLVDRVIPMLPHKLSNGICSLNENVDRFALSCIMDINEKGIVVSHEILETVINVNKKMTYTIVADLLTNENSQYLEQNVHLMPMFRSMEVLSSILRNKRIVRGAIEFDFAEAKIKVDENGKPTEIVPYLRNVATGIIEEFMLCANETIAERFFWLELPFVYRIHEQPDSERINRLAAFVRNLGQKFKGQGFNPHSIQTLLSKVENTPIETIVSKLVLRSFKQARYSNVNLGHFGLAAKYYCHFTSPIRRYPDLQIHRIIKQYLNDELNQNEITALEGSLHDICFKCSVNERKAEGCEREVETIKKLEFMEDKISQQFDGVISGVMYFGFFVTLTNTVEGLVTVESLYKFDSFDYDHEKMELCGEFTNKVYRLGDKVKVKVLKVDKENRRMELDVI